MNDNQFQNQMAIMQHLKDSKGIFCEKCSHALFKETYALRTISKLLLGSPSDVTVPYPVFACNACGHVNTDLRPKEFSLTDEASDKISNEG